MPLGPALARKDIACNDDLAAEQLDAKPLAVRVASVARRSACFFVRHRCSS
jgi:hypothetical protein